MTLPDSSLPPLSGYGRYPATLTADQLHHYFRFDDQDRQALTQKKGKHNRLGYALQLATVRFLGTFLSSTLSIFFRRNWGKSSATPETIWRC